MGAAETIEVPRAALEADRSAGWRLGATRRRLELIEPRIAQLAARVADFEAQGDRAQAERQRRVLTRFEDRRAELLDELPRLTEQARLEGSALDAEDGYAQAESEIRVRGATASVVPQDRGPSPAAARP